MTFILLQRHLGVGSGPPPPAKRKVLFQYIFLHVVQYSKGACVPPFGKCFLFRSLQMAGMNLSEQAGSSPSREEPCKTSPFGVGASPCTWPQASHFFPVEPDRHRSSGRGQVARLCPGGIGTAVAMGESRGLTSVACGKAADSAIWLNLPGVLRHRRPGSVALLLLFSACSPARVEGISAAGRHPSLPAHVFKASFRGWGISMRNPGLSG